MEVRISPDAEAKLLELSGRTGRPPAEIVEDALAGYSAEVDATRMELARRLHEVRAGNVKPTDAATAFSALRRKSEERRTRKP
ncbi:MAG: hypothetical protein ABL995_14210 [Bryobacteraceae bacterium]